MTPSVRFIKRAIDLAASSVGLALTLPLWPAIAVAIAVDSKGPVFFRQVRAGKLVEDDPPGAQPRWVEFKMVKFRTMGVDAEKGTGAVLATKGDPRITRVGRFLRKTRLDELPQFINVLRGDMSLIGPRPERPELLHNLSMAIPFFEERTRGIKPGITGLAQISLSYSGAPKVGSSAAALKESLTNPFDIDEAEGALADDMRFKLMYDLAYAAACETLASYVRMEAQIILTTPIVMLLSQGH